MTRMPEATLVAILSLSVTWIVAGCGSSTEGPCDGPIPAAACGSSCGSDSASSCPAGFYCADNDQCTADCFATESRGCPGGQRCTDDGRCVATASGDGDGGASDGTGDDSDVCADVTVSARRVTPTVMLIVDQSGSMEQEFSDSGSRWEVLRDSLLAQPDGLIDEFESRVRFGLALYSASNGGNEPIPAQGTCPMLTEVAPALDNYGSIEAVYSEAEPIEDTPTGDAVATVLDGFTSKPDPGRDPVVFILATDGEPDRCEQGDPQPTEESQQEALDAVSRAYEANIRTFLIDVGNGVSRSLKQEVANAGVGAGPGHPDAPFWTVTEDEGLRDALRTIIGGELSCKVELDGMIQDLDEVCSGTVKLNGRELPCNDPDGWRAVDPSHIELQGDACEELKSSDAARLEATFPCGHILI